MKNLFTKDKIYTEEELNKIASANSMITVNCLKEDNQITLEFEGEENLFELTRAKDNGFILTWCYLDNKNPKKCLKKLGKNN